MSYLQLHSINKAYYKGSIEIKALSDINLAVNKGEFISIVGKSGSGKSTLLNIIGGLDRPDSGNYRIDEDAISYESKKQLNKHRRKTVGMIFQSFNLINHKTALENVSFAMIFGRVKKSERKEKAVSLLEKVGLKDRMHHKPSELSGGEAQRVAIARALANSPSVLLADEPTGNLDSVTSKEIISLLVELNKKNGITVLMITHDKELAEKVSERVITLHDGEIQ